MMIEIALIFPILTNVQFDEKLGKKVIDEKHPSHDPKDGICCFSRMKYFFPVSTNNCNKIKSKQFAKVNCKNCKRSLIFHPTNEIHNLHTQFELS